mmetsp:Transcript_98479/g.306382  ORF Transcript_98479/g.306382 Transcript_98479/m.306382 type:complete len:227 (+) Transcript_98479:672-1352(+)
MPRTSGPWSLGSRAGPRPRSPRGTRPSSRGSAATCFSARRSAGPPPRTCCGTQSYRRRSVACSRKSRPNGARTAGTVPRPVTRAPSSTAPRPLSPLTPRGSLAPTSSGSPPGRRRPTTAAREERDAASDQRACAVARKQTCGAQMCRPSAKPWECAGARRVRVTPSPQSLGTPGICGSSAGQVLAQLVQPLAGYPTPLCAANGAPLLHRRSRSFAGNAPLQAQTLR